MLVDVIKVEVKSGRVVDLTFEDGKRRVIDLEPYLHGPVFDEIRTSDDRFREVRIRDGTIAWPNEADIAPETLYLGLPPGNRPLTPAYTLRLKRFLESADRFESRAPVSKRPLLQDPDISWFMGITVSIEFEKGALPQFRARYGETEAGFAIQTLRKLKGDMSPRALEFVREWAALHRKELAANWIRSRRGLPLKPIAPLE
jgi:hypothetical protein